MSAICLICNGTYMVQNKSRHLKSKKHLLALENKSENLNYYTAHVNKLQNELQVSRGILDKLVRDLSNKEIHIYILVKICAGATITTTSQSRLPPPQSPLPPPPPPPLQ